MPAEGSIDVCFCGMMTVSKRMNMIPTVTATISKTTLLNTFPTNKYPSELFGRLEQISKISKTFINLSIKKYKRIIRHY